MELRDGTGAPQFRIRLGGDAGLAVRVISLHSSAILGF
jgi:hypothetical protein